MIRTGWNHTLGNICRNIGTIWILAGERIDPQPEVTVRPFNVQTAQGTRGAEAHFTWRNLDFKETA
jgi:hypothetical protein